MNVTNFEAPKAHQSPGPVHGKGHFVSTVQFSHRVISLLKKFYSKKQSNFIRTLYKDQCTLLECEYGLTTEYKDGRAHYKIDSLQVGENKDWAFFDIIEWLINHRFITGVILFGFDEPDRMALSESLLFTVYDAMSLNSIPPSCCLTAADIYDSVTSGNGSKLVKITQEAVIFQIDEIGEEPVFCDLNGYPVEPIRDIVEDRDSRSQFTILSTELGMTELEEYFNKVTLERIRESYLYISVGDERKSWKKNQHL